ncbi:MAG: Rad52/Rad22 family DNA repair protein [Chloroflexi bacterium]|nr:Rad52/Rad22 family DNA repair protein [Chloroflexota bacterium]
MNNGTTATLNGSRNGSHPEPAGEIDLLWDGLPPAVTQRLGEPLDEGLVSHRKGRKGRSFAYIEGHVAIEQANRILGFGGWGYELVGDVTLREGESVDPKTGEAKPWRAYAATVRVTVPGSQPRTDTGFQAVADDTAEGHETAWKGAVTDALKRALRSYGEQFGNSLYGDGAPGDAAPALRRTIVSLGRKQGFDEGQVRDAVRQRTGEDLDHLPVSGLTNLVEAMTQKLQSSKAEAEPKAA